MPAYMSTSKSMIYFFDVITPSTIVRLNTASQSLVRGNNSELMLNIKCSFLSKRIKKVEFKYFFLYMLILFDCVSTGLTRIEIQMYGFI